MARRAFFHTPARRQPTSRDRAFRFGTPSTGAGPTVVACERCGDWTGVKPLCVTCARLDDRDCDPTPPFAGLTLVGETVDGGTEWVGPKVGIDGKPRPVAPKPPAPAPAKREIPAHCLHGTGSPDLDGAIPITGTIHALALQMFSDSDARELGQGRR